MYSFIIIGCRERTSNNYLKQLILAKLHHQRLTWKQKPLGTAPLDIFFHFVNLRYLKPILLQCSNHNSAGNPVKILKHHWRESNPEARSKLTFYYTWSVIFRRDGLPDHPHCDFSDHLDCGEPRLEHTVGRLQQVLVRSHRLLRGRMPGTPRVTLQGIIAENDDVYARHVTQEYSF